MSENLLVAIIGLTGAAFAAFIGAFGAIAAARIKGKDENGSVNSSGFSCGIIGLAASVMGVIGLVLGVFFGSFIVQNTGAADPQPTVIVQQPVSTAPTQIVGAATTTSAPLPTLLNNSTTRPSPIHVVNGEYYSLQGSWTWICTGDFSTQMNGIKKAWYDVGVSNTGLVFVLQPDSNFTISGPFEIPVGVDVGDCLPYAQDEKDSGISSAISTQFDRGCGSKCEYVNVIELDKDGNKANDYWIPQKP